MYNITVSDRRNQTITEFETFSAYMDHLLETIEKELQEKSLYKTIYLESGDIEKIDESTRKFDLWIADEEEKTEAKSESEEEGDGSDSEKE